MKSLNEYLNEVIAQQEYVYHVSHLPNLKLGLRSIIKSGLQPSKVGYSGPGVYFAYKPDGGFYHVDASEATMFRAKWKNLVAHYGVYPQAPNGIQRDDDEIIVPTSVPVEMLEVEYNPGEWWDVKSALAAENGPMNEVTIDNKDGAGAVPYNADIDYFGLRVQMKPSTFLRLAEPLGKPHDPELEKYMAAGGATGSPFLEIAIPEEWDVGNFSKVAQVKRHEGRNRATITQKLEGDSPIEVHLIPLGGYRNRDLTPEFIKALSDGLFAERTTRVVNGPLFTAMVVTEDDETLPMADNPEHVRMAELKRLMGAFPNSADYMYSIPAYKRARLLFNKGLLKASRPEIELLLKLTTSTGDLKPLSEEEELTELFEPSNKEWKWKHHYNTSAIALFKIGKIPYMFMAETYTHPDSPESAGMWDVVFKIDKHYSGYTDLEATSYGITGSGNSAEVMGTVVNILKDFISIYKETLRGITFVANEDSRQSLYAKMAHRLLPNWEFYKDGKEFILSKPEDNVNESVVNESLSRIAYHYTSLSSALNILTTGQFQLASTLGSVEEKYAPQGHHYFMSTTRSSRGGYHDSNVTKNSTSGILFALDGNWFNQHYKAGPIDYWQNRNQNQRFNVTHHESEDRIFSRTPTIPIGGITAVHVFMKVMDNKERDNYGAMAPANARQLLLRAKTLGIKAYLYEDVTAWHNLDIRKTVPITNRETLRGPDLKKERTSSKPRGYLMPWMELLQAKEVSQLSKAADRIRYSLQYTYDAQSAIEGLANNLSNARKPDSGGDRENAAKLIRFMQQNKLNTISELVKAIGDKWKAIAAKKPANEVIESDTPIKLTSNAKAKGWIDKVYARYPQMFQRNHVMPLGGAGNDQQFAMFELTPSFAKRDAVEVTWIQAYPMGQGVGARAMKELQALATADGISLTLFPWDKGQVSQAKLTKFYKGQGFKPTAKGSRTMAWSPITELFEPSTKDWKWEFRGKYTASAVFTVEGIPYKFHASTEPDPDIYGIWDIEFTIETPRPPGRSVRYNLSGTGNSAAVMGTIVDIMRAFLIKYKDNIGALQFSADEVSRKSLYKRMIQRLLPNWKLKSYPGDMFSITPPALRKKVIKPTVETARKTLNDYLNIVIEDFNSNPYSKTTLPLGPYRGLSNPLDNDHSESYEASELWDIVEDQIEKGIKPTVIDFPINQLEATQDWLSSEAGDEALFDEYTDHPVVLAYAADNYILDGHNRIAAAIKNKQVKIPVFLFDADVKVTEGESNMKIRELLMNGGWASDLTFSTVITPAVVQEMVKHLAEFEQKFNEWEKQGNMGLEINIGKPVGSGTYYERDLIQDPTREYGDVDVMCYITSLPDESAAQRIAVYRTAIQSFCQLNAKYKTDNGTNVIFDSAAGPVQVDLVYTFHEHANWGRALAPEYRVKGAINTSLTSAMADALNLSFSSQGVQAKLRNGQPVSFRQSKDTILHMVSIDPENWAKDIYSFYYELAKGEKPTSFPGGLEQHSGIKDEQRLSDIVYAIKSLVAAFEQSMILPPDLMNKIADIFVSKMDAQIGSSKYLTAQTPEAVAKADKTKAMFMRYKEEIPKLLLS